MENSRKKYYILKSSIFIECVISVEKKVYSPYLQESNNWQNDFSMFTYWVLVNAAIKVDLFLHRIYLFIYLFTFTKYCSLGFLADQDKYIYSAILYKSVIKLFLWPRKCFFVFSPKYRLNIFPSVLKVKAYIYVSIAAVLHVYVCKQFYVVKW